MPPSSRHAHILKTARSTVPLRPRRLLVVPRGSRRAHILKTA
ncbi:MAG: hypothetical protein OXG81_12125 [Acidobacteria bacterium]|nr:hypothetical protein [Acidobacteriota bacterium]